MVHKTFCFAVFFYYYILLFFTVSTQNSFTKIKSVLRFLAVCGTVLGGRNAHDGFENTVKMIDFFNPETNRLTEQFEARGFAGLMLLQIGQHMVRRDKTDIRRDITAFANDDFGGKILKIAAERVKIIHIIRVENQIFRAAYFIAERNRERNIAIDALYLLHPQVSPAPRPAETGFLKPAATQKLFIVKQRHNKF